MQIEKRDYSSNPWRLVDDRGEEIYIPQEIDHPTMGRQTINMPFCAETKSQLVHKVLELLEKMNELRRKQAAEILELKNERAELRNEIARLNTHCREMVDSKGKKPSDLIQLGGSVANGRKWFAFRFRVWLYPSDDDFGSWEVHTWSDGLDPVSPGSRSIAEWAEESMRESDLHRLFGLDQSKFWQVVGEGKICCWEDRDGEFDEDIDIIKCESQEVDRDSFMRIVEGWLSVEDRQEE